MKSRTVCITVLLAIAYQAESQIQLESFELSFSPKIGSLDKSGNLFLADDDGNLYRLGKSFEINAQFSPSFLESPTTLEAGNGLKILTFYKSSQEILLLNRNLSLEQRIPSFIDIVDGVDQCTITNDGHIWILDQRQQSLSKFNINFRTLVAEVQLPDTLVGKVNSIKANQGIVSIGTLDKVLVFDDNGLYLKTFSLLEGKILFEDDYIVCLTDEHLLVQNMFSESSTSFEIQSNDLNFLGFDGRYLYMAKEQTLLKYLLFK